MNTLLLGLGNPILGDDAIGWQVVLRAVERMKDHLSEFEADCCCLGGLSLIERLADYDRAIIVDAIHTGQAPAGTIYHLSLDDLPSIYVNTSHDLSFKEAVDLGRELGIHLPDDIRILAVEIDRLGDLSEWLSPEVGASVEGAIQSILVDASGWGN